MIERTYEYDPADALDSPEAIEAFVTDAFETGDASYIAKALGVTAEIVETPFPERIPALMSGRVDVGVHEGQLGVVGVPAGHAGVAVVEPHEALRAGHGGGRLGLGPAQLGEVALVRHGERVSLSATAETAIPRGSRVRITQTLTATSVMVAPLEAATPQP